MRSNFHLACRSPGVGQLTFQDNPEELLGQNPACLTVCLIIPEKEMHHNLCGVDNKRRKFCFWSMNRNWEASRQLLSSSISWWVRGGWKISGPSFADPCWQVFPFPPKSISEPMLCDIVEFILNYGAWQETALLGLAWHYSEPLACFLTHISSMVYEDLY